MTSNFGSLDVTVGSPVDSTSTITIGCFFGGPPANKTYRNCVSIGAGSQGDATSRIMSSGPNMLRFDLYADAARTIKWGSWQTGYGGPGQTIDLAFNSISFTTLYARVLGSQQTVPAGPYSSSFVANPFTRYLYNPGPLDNCPVGALTTAGFFTVSAVVIPSCSVSASDLNFGTTAILSANTDQVGSINATCTNQLSYTVSLSGGDSGATDPTQRKMSKGAEQVTYGLYRDAARVLPWGDTIGTDTLAATGTGLAQSHTVYGRVPPQTTPSTGTYVDTIIVTVTY